MTRIEKTVFISYRRTNLPWALFIYQNLTMHGYDVFFDYQSIDSGNFESVILDNVRARAHFIVILTPSALENCNKPEDWLRREIETAIDENRNIIPLMVENFDFGSPLVKETLTGKLVALSTYNGLPVPNSYALEAMNRLRERYLDKALSEIPTSPLQTEAQKITETQKAAASEAAPVQEEELTAQIWFERGFVFGLDNNFDESIRCFTEALRLRPTYEAYFNRGIVWREIGELDEAVDDYNHAIPFNPKEAQTYNNRGNALRDKGDLDGAISDYNKAIILKPNAARVFTNRGIVWRIKGNLDGALEDYTKAIRLNPSPLDLAEALYNQGVVFQLKGNLEDAIRAFQKTIRIQPYHVIARAYLISVLRKLGKNSEADEQEKLARALFRTDDEYNQACFEVVCGNTDKALKLLRIGLEKKQSTKEWARQDPDFDNFRDDPRFKELVGK